MSANDREVLAARKALNAKLKAAQAVRGLNMAAQHTDKTVLYKAVAHALCYRAQFSGVSQVELSDLLHDRQHATNGTLSLSAALHKKIEGRLGLARTSEPERKAINKLLGVIYQATDDVPTSVMLEIFIRFMKVNAPQIGLPVDVAVTRIENLDALTRFAGTPKRYIPEDQYGL